MTPPPDHAPAREPDRSVGATAMLAVLVGGPHLTALFLLVAGAVGGIGFDLPGRFGLDLDHVLKLSAFTALLWLVAPAAIGSTRRHRWWWAWVGTTLTFPVGVIGGEALGAALR